MTWAGESGPGGSGLYTYTSDGSPGKLTGDPGQVVLWENGTPEFMPQSAISGSQPTSINQIGDVDTSGLTSGQVLKWNGSEWVPSSDIAGSGAVNAATPPTTDNAIVRWDGTTGDMIQNSNVLIDDNDNVNLPSGSVYKIDDIPLVIDDLADVSTSGIDAPMTNEFLGWDGSQWRPGTPAGQGGPLCAITGADNTITTSSTTPVAVPNTSVTPASGTYFVTFSTTSSMNKNGQFVEAGIYVDDIESAFSHRELGGQSNNRGNFNCQARVIVDGTQVVEARWNITSAAGGGQGTMFERTLSLVECTEM
jgi:hypothetical protein